MARGDPDALGTNGETVTEPNGDEDQNQSLTSVEVALVCFSNLCIMCI